MRLMWHLQRAARLASHQLSWYSLWMFLPPSICDTLRPECCTCSCCDCDCYGNSDGNAHIPWLNQKPAAAATAPSSVPPAPPASRRLFAFFSVFFALFAQLQLLRGDGRISLLLHSLPDNCNILLHLLPISIYPSYPILFHSPHTHTDSHFHFRLLSLFLCSCFDVLVDSGQMEFNCVKHAILAELRETMTTFCSG